MYPGENKEAPPKQLSATLTKNMHVPQEALEKLQKVTTEAMEDCLKDRFQDELEQPIYRYKVDGCLYC